MHRAATVVLAYLASLAGLAGTAAATPGAELARGDHVCDRLVAALDAAAPPRRLHKAWIARWSDDRTPRDLPRAVAPHVTRVLGERSGMVLVVGTTAQLDDISAELPVYAQYADELDDVTCGSLGFTAAPTGAVRPAVRLPSAWRARGRAATFHCVQLLTPASGDHDEALARAIGRDDLPLVCDATCVLPLTAAQAAAVARLPFVRGVWRREPAYTLDSSLICDTGDLPVPPAEWPAFLAAVASSPDEELTVEVSVDDEARAPEIIAAMGTRAFRARDGGLLVTLRRRELPALAALPAVWSITRRAWWEPALDPTL